MDSCPKNLEKFVDYDKCFELIKELETKLDLDSNGDEENEVRIRCESERLVESFRKVIDFYQEQPELLDPYLSELIKGLTSGLDDFNISGNRYHTVFKFLYQLIKVTGFKSIGKKFPHDTNKLPLLVELLSKEDPQDKANWQTRFVLTVWLSIVIMTPFDLAKFDNSESPSDDNQKISDRIYNTLMRSLTFHDSCQHVTSYCLAKFFSRPDMLKSDQRLSEFLSLALDELRRVKLGFANSMDDIKLIGYLRTLAYMFKFMPRAEMKQRCPRVLSALLEADVEKINRELVNHMIIKLIQRSGLALLPKRVAVWRYKRGSRILGQISVSEEKGMSIKAPASENQLVVDGGEEEQQLAEHEQEEIMAAEHLESILSVLFVAAQNSQTRIRWSAAKGIARLASRLSRERASDVIDMVLKNFFNKTTSSEFAWHSGCLALAEMSRHGLIMEEKLAEVSKIIGQAIVYDKIKGNLAVGSHIREAACYVCWAMARTYEDHLLEPYISAISINLLCTMLFDRELQCRRAASATFQELVGRQGTFSEEGISILTQVDYQNVGQRPFSYCHLALQVASYGEKYSHPFIQHLIDQKLGHWDIQIRRLASDSLAALMLYSSVENTRNQVLPKLVSMCEQERDINAKHGAILGLAKVIKSLANLQFEFSPELVDFVGQLGKKCHQQLRSKQQAANFLEAMGHVVSSAEAANFKYDADGEIVKHWESISLIALDNDKSDLRDIGSTALLTLYKSFYRGYKGHQDRLLTTLNKSLMSPNEASRCGALRALAKLSQIPSLCSASTVMSKGDTSWVKTDADTPDIILQSLVAYIGRDTQEPKLDMVFAEAKAQACESLVDFVRHLDGPLLLVRLTLLEAAYEVLLKATADYTFDKRGDIGVLVRRAAISALARLTDHLLAIGMQRALFEGQDRASKMLSAILQQCVSYHNTCREQAAQAFHKLVSILPSELVPHHQKILELFARHQVDDQFNWRDDSTPIFVGLLDKQEYQQDLWQGLIPSVGQVSDMCARQFRDALSDYLRSLEAQEEAPGSSAARDQVLAAFLDILERPKLPERLLTQGLVVADYLLVQCHLNNSSRRLQQRLLDLCRHHYMSTIGIIRRSAADDKRLSQIVRVETSMLQFQTNPEIQRQCLHHCCWSYLSSGLPKLRQVAADQLYLSIMTYQADLELGLGLAGERLERAMDLLNETNWLEPLDKIKLVRDQVAQLLGELQAPQEPEAASASPK